MLVDICSPTCLIATDLAGMVFDFKVNTFYVLSQRARTKTFVRTNVASEVSDFEMDTTDMTNQVTVL